MHKQSSRMLGNTDMFFIPIYFYASGIIIHRQLNVMRYKNNCHVASHYIREWRRNNIVIMRYGDVTTAILSLCYPWELQPHNNNTDHPSNYDLPMHARCLMAPLSGLQRVYCVGYKVLCFQKIQHISPSWATTKCTEGRVITKLMLFLYGKHVWCPST